MIRDQNPQRQPAWFPGKPTPGLLTNTIMVSTYRDMGDGVMESKIFIVYHSLGVEGVGWRKKRKPELTHIYTFVVVVDMIFSPNYQK